MTTLAPLTDEPATYARKRLLVPRPRIPEDLEVLEELGKGSNNKVFRARWKGQPCALRVPRRRSDTQQHGSALWEFRHMLKAAQLGVGPQVYDAWQARHAKGEWPSGLYAITELLEHDFDAVLDKPELRERASDAKLGEAIVECLRALADAKVFVWDLKPSNVMVRFRDGGVDARVIDFGRDFCEWGECEADPDASTPVLDGLRKRVDGDDARMSHVLFATMLVQLAATTTHQLYHDRRDHRMSADERLRANPMAPLASRLLDGMQGQNVALMRQVLRADPVRGVMRHYHGRRNSGTRRTLGFARGVERP